MQVDSTLNTGATKYDAREYGASARQLFFSMLPIGIVVIAVVAYVLIALFHIRNPGLYYDESLFVNAALGAPDNDDFVSYRIFGVPVMNFPYVGALKSFVYAPIFAIFGVSLLSIRLPAVLLSAGTIIMIYGLLGRFIPRWIAAVTTAFIAIDTAFVLMTRVDEGPIVLMLLLKVAAIYALVRSLQTNSWRFFSFSLVLLALGVWDKLNFIWIVVGLGAASIVYWRALLRLWRTHPAIIFLSGAIFLAVMGFFYYSLIHPLLGWQSKPNLNLISRFGTISELCKQSFNGRFFCDWVFEHNVCRPAICPIWLVPLSLIMAIISYAALRMKGGERRQADDTFIALAFFVILYSTMLFEIVITSQAWAAHHIMVLWPFQYIIFAISLTILGLAIPVEIRRSAIAVFLIGLCVWAGINTFRTIDMLCAFKTQPLKAIWSNEIYDLAKYVRAHGKEADSIISVDWGTHNQVSALVDAKLRKKCSDQWPVYRDLQNNPITENKLGREYGHGRTMVILLGKGRSLYPGMRENFFNLIKDKRLSCRRLTVINDSLGPVYEVYTVKRNARPSGNS